MLVFFYYQLQKRFAMDNEHALAILGGVSSTVRAIPFFASHKIEILKKKKR